MDSISAAKPDQTSSWGVRHARGDSRRHCTPSHCALAFVAIASAMLAGCGSGGYVRPLSASDRARLSAVRVATVHYRKPSHAHGLVDVTIGPHGRSVKRSGATRYWSDQRYTKELTSASERVQKALESAPEGTDPVKKAIIDAGLLGQGGTLGRIELVKTVPTESAQGEEASASAKNASKKLPTLRILVYHKVRLDGVFIADQVTYTAFNARLIDTDGSVLYSRLIFSDVWTLSDEFLKQKYHHALFEFINGAARQVRNDLSE